MSALQGTGAQVLISETQAPEEGCVVNGGSESIQSHPAQFITTKGSGPKSCRLPNMPTGIWLLFSLKNPSTIHSAHDPSCLYFNYDWQQSELITC